MLIRNINSLFLSGLTRILDITGKQRENEGGDFIYSWYIDKMREFLW
jgi:hypothetical protein